MSCCDTSGLMPVSTAISLLLENTAPLSSTQKVPLNSALHRVLAEDIQSPLNVPPFANSAMDGYAVRCADLLETNTLTLRGHCFAGAPFVEEGAQKGQWVKNTCIRIMTGAPLPPFADAVIMQEQALATGNKIGDTVTFEGAARLQQNIRPVGEDVKKDDIVLKKGALLTPRDIPMLATLGIANVTVFCKPTVAFFSTGDELRQVGEPLGEGEIYDSNRYTIHAMLTKMHCDIVDLGVVPDCPEKLRAALLHAADVADLVITSGGVSVGDADHIKDVLEHVGQIGFWKIAIKPGKPFAFGKVNNALFCGLPGNPVSVLVTLHVLVQPLLAKLSGHSQWKPEIMLTAKATSRFKKSPGRTDFQRALYHVDENGALCVSSMSNQGSGVFSALSCANCFAVLEQARGSIEIGESIHIEPFGSSLN